MFLYLLPLLFAFSCVLSDPGVSRVFLENNVITHYIPDGWVKVGAAEDDSEITLLVGVQPQNRDKLKELLDETGSPSSPLYGKWWEKRDVDRLVEPAASTKERVRSWLQTEGIVHIRERTPLWWEVKCTARQASSLLHVSFFVFSHPSSNTKLIRSLELYTVPENMASSLTLIANVFRFPGVSRSVHPVRSSSPSATILITPEVLQKKYKVTVPPSNSTNIQAVGSFLGQYYSANDLQDFHDDFFPSLSADCQLTRTIGDNNFTAPGIEAALDTQYIQFGNCSVETWDYSIPGETQDGNEPFLNWLLELDKECSLSVCPFVYSLSYGDYENTVSRSYAEAIDLQFEIITMTGRTFFAASGDVGVGCTDIGYGPGSFTCTYFNPIFISTSPYVVSVGSTLFTSSEVSVSFTGGGFSSYFRQPSYQTKAVEAYFSQGVGVPSSSFYNMKGRGFPDVAVVGVNYMVYWKGVKIPVDGTSASTPAFAAMMSMINNLRFNAHLPPLGFANPFLYEAWAQSSQSSPAFYDIVQGQTQAHGCCPSGFAAVVGWEPVCGLGTPDYSVLSQLALSPSMFPYLFENK